MAQNTNRKTLFVRLKRGLKEAIAHCQGKQRLRTAEVSSSVSAVDGASLVTNRKQCE